MLTLQHKTALITGASRGLGLSITKSLWKKGVNLILVARSIDKLKQCQNELLEENNHHQQIEIVSTDLANPSSVDTLINNVSHHKIDILINNAAIQGPIGPLWENDWHQWQAALQVNLLAPIALSRSIIPGMIKRNDGKIINLSGGGAANARPFFSAYAVAKAGLVRFSETLADEIKSYNIYVNCLAPGLMNTDMLTHIMKTNPELIARNEVKTADGRSSIENATQLCDFLASSKSNGINGKLISAAWDPWMQLPEYIDELKNSDIYTLRRIVPKDRGKNWSHDL